MSHLHARLCLLNRRLDCGGETTVERIFDALYRVARYREETDPPKARVIDLIMTPTMRTYFCAIVKRDQLRRFGPEAVRITQPENGENPDVLGGITWSIFDIPEYGFRVAAMETKIFGTPAEDEIWCIDWSDVSWGGGIEHPERHIIFANVKELR